MSAVIPETFSEWQHCIVNECGIKLTHSYIEQRLVILRELHHEETQRFIQIYGETHWQFIASCFEHAKKQQ